MLSRVHNTLVTGRSLAGRCLSQTFRREWVPGSITRPTRSVAGRTGSTPERSPPTIRVPPRVLRPLVAEWTARFAALEPDAIDAAVAECLGQVAASLELDRAILWLTNPTDGSASAAACWMRGAPEPGGDPLVMRVALATLEMGAGDGRCQTHITARPAAGPEAGRPGGCRSALIVLGAFAGQTTREHYVLECGSLAERAWAPPTIELRVIAGVLAQALARKTTPHERQPAREGLIVLPETTAEEGRRHSPAVTHSDDVYRRDLPEQSKEPLIGRSRALREVLDQIHQVAATDSTVLLLGETGTGKELLATHLHEMSARRARSMVRVNCAAIPATLIESELFGREKGAYTGSLARQIGRFELADRSTIFLDEIGDLPADVQVKLLRVLEERRIERLGSPQRHPGRRAHCRRHASQPRRAHCRRRVPRGLVLPFERLPRPRAAIAGPSGRHSSVGVAVR